MFALTATIFAVSFVAAIQFVTPYQMGVAGGESVVFKKDAIRRIVKRAIISWVLLQLVFVFQSQPANWYAGDDNGFLATQVAGLLCFMIASALDKDVVIGKLERGGFAVAQFLRVLAVLSISISWLVNLY